MASSTHERNAGIPLDLAWIERVRVNLPALLRRAATLKARRSVKMTWQAAWLLRAVTLIDLTTLSGDDTDTNVERLCFKARTPVQQDLVKALGVEDKKITVAAVCVYPSHVVKAVETLKGSGIPVASVAAGFPAGSTSMTQRLAEIREAVASGATEIDIVITRSHVLSGNWQALYDETKQMREACGDAHLKSIIAVGELGTMANIYKASLVCMMAGSDVVKTSTGKEAVNATIPIGIVMLRAIRAYYEATGIRVGFKAAGGIKTAKDALAWLWTVKEELDESWVTPELFRIGASSLLMDIERQLYHCVTGKYAAIAKLPMS